MATILAPKTKQMEKQPANLDQARGLSGREIKIWTLQRRRTIQSGSERVEGPFSRVASHSCFNQPGKPKSSRKARPFPSTISPKRNGYSRPRAERMKLNAPSAFVLEDLQSSLSSGVGQPRSSPKAQYDLPFPPLPACELLINSTIRSPVPCIYFLFWQLTRGGLCLFHAWSRGETLLPRSQLAGARERLHRCSPSSPTSPRKVSRLVCVHNRLWGCD